MLHSFRIIPDRGSWIEAQFDTSDLLYVYLDRRKRRRKFLTTTFFRALGYPAPTRTSSSCSTRSIEARSSSENLDEEEICHKVLIEDIRDGEDHGGARLRAAVQGRSSAHAARATRPSRWSTPRWTTRSSSAEEGSRQERGRGAQGHLPPAAPRRSADRAECPRA